MMPIEAVASSVPDSGPLTRGAIYKRKSLHLRFGGTRYKGIVPSTTEPVVLLFHTQESSQQFYKDGYDDDGIYWYSGMGASGDMRWNTENFAVRDHLEDGRDLLFFERFRRKGGLWKFEGERTCLGFKIEARPDQSGEMREAIIFALSEASEQRVSTRDDDEVSRMPLNELRAAAMENASSQSSFTERLAKSYRRSAAIRAYAIRRADGNCEACGERGPFMTANGQPFLEIHHLRRLADSGPDCPDGVAAVCPNCHRRCHHSEDAKAFNDRLASHVAEMEAHG